MDRNTTPRFRGLRCKVDALHQCLKILRPARSNQASIWWTALRQEMRNRAASPSSEKVKGLPVQFYSHLKCLNSLRELFTLATRKHTPISLSKPVTPEKSNSFLFSRTACFTAISFSRFSASSASLPALVCSDACLPFSYRARWQGQASVPGGDYTPKVG